jgi:hypothetical protein
VRRFVATLLVTAAAALGAVGTPAAAPPNFTAAEHICTADGGVFASFGSTYYLCGNFSGFTSDLRAARALCENAYGGHFRTVPPARQLYDCILA